VFELDPPAALGGASTETVLHSFSGLEGFMPNPRLTLRQGGIYGTTAQGGLFGTGTVYVLTPQRMIDCLAARPPCFSRNEEL
jgi:hypothetical protein